ncbi:putative major facilitator superfamily, MFS transporter superfamily [Helianthus anomalus]
MHSSHAKMQLVGGQYYPTVAFRLVGVGEASFISLAAPFIDDNAPVAQRTTWLGIFYMCIPTGISVGYVYGGVVSGSAGWRYAFFGEAILMLPFAMLGFAMKSLQMKGYIAYNFVIGAYSYWGPKAGYSIYQMGMHYQFRPGKRVGSWVETGQLKKGCFGSGQNGFGSEQVRVRTGFGSRRVGLVKNDFKKK